MRADRLLNIMMLLQTRGKLTTQALADGLEISRRTVLRDIEALSIAGVPIYTESGHGGGIYLDEKYRVSLTGLQEAELRSLFVSTMPGPLADIGLGLAAESSLLKLFAALPTAHQGEVERMRQRMHLDPTGWWPSSDSLSFLNDLLNAVYQDCRIKVVYEQGSGTLIERTLEPYSLVAKANVWYLIASHNGQLRIYRVTRFQAVELLAQTFERSPDFDLAGYWTQHCQTFVANRHQYVFTLRIKDEYRFFLKWYAWGEYEIIAPSDETGWFTARIELGSLDAAGMLVFGLGKNTEVVEPAELADHIKNKIKELTIA